MAKFKIYDENDNFLGEYIGEFIENSKEEVSESFDGSIGGGLLAILILLCFKFPWLILVIIGWFILKFIFMLLGFALRICWWIFRLIVFGIWWLIKLPFTLLFHKEMPYWEFPEWSKD